MSRPTTLLARRPLRSAAAEAAAVLDAATDQFAGENPPVGGRRYGVDIDGTTVRVVEVDGTTVLSFAAYQGNTAPDAFQQFLDTRPQGHVVVVWADGEVHLRRVPLPNLPTAALRAGLLDAIEETLPMAPGTAVVAARVTALKDDHGLVASVAATDRFALADLWSMVTVPSACVVPAPLLFVEDGLYLGLRDGGAQLLLASGGAAVATRNLSAGGLITVRDELADGDQSPEERLTTIARGGTRLDPGAASAVDRYAQAISDEVRRTADFWSRQGMAVPAEIYVHGQGIALPNLAGKLLDAAFLAKGAPTPLVVMDAIARADVPRAYLALLATQYNPAVQVISDLPDPLAAERVRRRNEKARTSGRLALAGVTVAALASVLVGPVVLAKRDLATARRDLGAAEAELRTLSPAVKLANQVSAGRKAYRTAVTDEVNWSAYLNRVLVSAPADASPSFVSLTAERKGHGVNLDVKAELVGTDFVPVADWLRGLKNVGLTVPWSPTFRAEPGTAGQPPTILVAFTASTPLTSDYYATRDVATRVRVGPSGTPKSATTPATTPAATAGTGGA